MPAERGITTGLPIILLWSGLFGVCLLWVVPFLVYHLRTASVPPWFAAAVAAVQITAIAGLVTGRWTLRYRALLVLGLLGVAGALAILSGMPERVAGLAVAGCCHAIAYSSLLIWFGTSLRAYREPVVTGFARRLRQTMPGKVVRYTRRVTIAWCVFFAGQLIVSATLLLLAPGPVWSAFVNLLNLPLVATMVLAEFGYRLILFRNEPHTGLIDTLSALRHARFTTISRP